MPIPIQFVGMRAACLLAAVAAAGAVDVSLVAMYPLGQGRALTVRGDGCGLSWDRGLALQAGAQPNAYSAALSCAADLGRLEFKVLMDDQIWQVGANEAANLTTRPSQIVAYPWFYSGNGTLETLTKASERASGPRQSSDCGANARAPRLRRARRCSPRSWATAETWCCTCRRRTARTR